MPTTTRLLTLCLLCGGALLALPACDPCAAEPALCMPGVPDAGTTDPDAPTEGETDDDGGATEGTDAPEPGVDDGMVPDAGTSGSDDGDGDGGGGGGTGESGGDTGTGRDAGESGESGGLDPDTREILACWSGFDACLESGAKELACVLELRLCMLDAASGIPDAECLDGIAGCLLGGGTVRECLDEADACSDAG